MQPSPRRREELRLSRKTVKIEQSQFSGSMTRLQHGQHNNLAFRGRSSVSANASRSARLPAVSSLDHCKPGPTSKDPHRPWTSDGQTLIDPTYALSYGHSLPTPFSLAVSPTLSMNDAEYNEDMEVDIDAQEDAMDEDDDDGSAYDTDLTVLNATSWSQGHTLNRSFSLGACHMTPDIDMQTQNGGMNVNFQNPSIVDFQDISEDLYDETSFDALWADPFLTGQAPDPFMTRGRSPAPDLYPPIQPRPQHSGAADETLPTRNTFASGSGIRRRGRDGPLSETKKAAAARVRLRGACARCHTMKERCDDKTPCGPCQNPHRRKHDLPCMKAWPSEKACHVLSDLTIGDLNWQAFRKTLPPGHIHMFNIRFTIPLRQDFEKVLHIPVREFQPRNERDVYKITFPIREDGEKFQVDTVKILSPPLVVDIRSKEQLNNFITSVHRQTKIWLRDIEDDYGAEWSATFFPPEYGQKWPRAVLWHVCAFFNWAMKRGCPALSSALKTTVITHMIGHAFYIVPDKVEEVLSKMQYQLPKGEKPGHFVCPHFIDRLLKVALCPLLSKYLQLSLQSYEDLAKKEKQPSHLTRDRIFCISIVLLIIGAVQQAKSVEKNSVHMRHGEARNMNRAHSRIVEIEREFIESIFDIWNYKFKIDDVMRGDVEGTDRPLATRAKAFDVLGRFKTTYEDHQTELADIDTAIPEVPDVRAFSATNVMRVLKRFYLVVFENDKGRSAEAEV